MQKAQILTWIILAFALIGLADTAYLSALHFSGEVPVCTVTETCDVVLTSTYSTLVGIPVALLGLLYYVGVFALGLLAQVSRKEYMFEYLGMFSIVGLLASLYFIFLQAFVIEAWCQYCLLSAFTSSAIFALGIAVFAIIRQRKNSGVYTSSLSEQHTDNE